MEKDNILRPGFGAKRNNFEIVKDNDGNLSTAEQPPTQQGSLHEEASLQAKVIEKLYEDKQVGELSEVFDDLAPDYIRGLLRAIKVGRAEGTSDRAMYEQIHDKEKDLVLASEETGIIYAQNVFLSSYIYDRATESYLI